MLPASNIPGSACPDSGLFSTHAAPFNTVPHSRGMLSVALNSLAICALRLGVQEKGAINLVALKNRLPGLRLASTEARHV